jgi:deoxyribodipyrimidine photo-lyase
MDVPEVLKTACDYNPVTPLPQTDIPDIVQRIPTLVYNAYNLDPLWHRDMEANRILLLEPSHFEKYPVSGRVIDFLIALAGNIAGIQVFTAEFTGLVAAVPPQDIIYKAHPAFGHYRGKAEPSDFLFPQVSGYYNSFSAYWKQCAKYLR